MNDIADQYWKLQKRNNIADQYWKLEKKKGIKLLISTED